MTKLKELKKKIDGLQAKMKSESEIEFKEESKAIFEKYPEIENFSWTQYTPYFNDGDECTFSVNTDPKINGSDEYEEESEKINKKAFRDISKLLNEIDEQSMKAIWGDHMEVTMSRSGKISSDEYSHN